MVGNASIAYNRMDVDELGTGTCLLVAVQLENAFNAYTGTVSRWNDCIFDFGCDTDAITPGLQDKWLRASRAIDRAESRLDKLDRTQPLATTPKPPRASLATRPCCWRCRRRRDRVSGGMISNLTLGQRARLSAASRAPDTFFPGSCSRCGQRLRRVSDQRKWARYRHHPGKPPGSSSSGVAAGHRKPTSQRTKRSRSSARPMRTVCAPAQRQGVCLDAVAERDQLIGLDEDLKGLVGQFALGHGHSAGG